MFMASTSTPATTLLKREKVDHRVHEYSHDPKSGSYGSEAVEALGERLGVAAAQIFKTLVISLSDGSLAVAVIPVPDTLSLKAAAGALGGGKAAMAERTLAERATGYVLGGISPLGQRKRLRTVVDASAQHWDRVLCSAGRRGLEIELAPADLIRLTDAVVAPVASGR
jgi:Cys-tRNA(Pro)/Cys-tRNA(Cys) deacylase